ncbi:MAG: BBP7 family outer membrane beta-barrel protein [Rubripirellula sp.]
MNPRWFFVLTSLLTLVASVEAQRPAVVAYPNAYAPIVTNLGVADPYATVGVRPAGWFGNNGLALPTRQSIGSRLWLRAEYLHWWTEGMDTPALVTTSTAGTPQNQAAILGEPGASILFGGREINDDSESGIRTRAGFWLNSQRAFAIESEYFQLRDQDDRYNASGDGSNIVGRPFFDITNGRETAQLVSFPGLVSGAVSIGSKTELKSFLLNGRASLCPTHGSACDAPGQHDRVDWIVGYRYLELDDRITFAESLNSLVPTAPGTLGISESFRTKNEFNGLQLGVVYQANFRRAWLESLLRVAVGHNTQKVQIQGGTAITENGTTDNFSGGLLAQRTNIGNFERDQFTMIPEIGLTFGFRVTDWMHATVGYTVLYYPSVVRAGDQIDTDVNPNLLAPEMNPFSGTLRPRFQYNESDYWAQGINLGAEFRF